MLDSLLELIAGIFIAAVPILLLISRRQSRNAGRTGRTVPADDGGATPKGRLGRAADRLRDRLGRRRRRASAEAEGADTSREGRSLAAARTGGAAPGGYAASASTTQGQTARSQTARGQRDEQRRQQQGTKSVFDYQEEAPSEARPRGAGRLMERVNRYPPLQRAIVLKEILDNPKGID